MPFTYSPNTSPNPPTWPHLCNILPQVLGVSLKPVPPSKEGRTESNVPAAREWHAAEHDKRRAIRGAELFLLEAQLQPQSKRRQKRSTMPLVPRCFMEIFLPFFFNGSNTFRFPFRRPQLRRANSTPCTQVYLPSKQVSAIILGSAEDQPLNRDLKPPSRLGTKTGLFRAAPAASQSHDQLYTACLKGCCRAGRGPTGSCTS